MIELPDPDDAGPSPAETQIYLPAAFCPHREPAPGSDAWDEWFDEHPESSTLDVGHICLDHPLGADGSLTRAPFIGYYVTVRRNRRTGRLLGPYERHIDALANVERARLTAEEIDPWAAFDAFGTARVQSALPLRAGCLNAQIGLEVV